MKKLLLSLLSVMMVFCLSVTAQVTTSGIEGYVYGEDNQPVAGAAIRAVHTPSGTTYMTTTLSNGRFLIGGMRVGGPYTIEVSYLGFNTEIRNNVYLSLGEEAAFSFTLKEAASTTLGQIVVTGRGNTPIFSSNRTGSEEIITSQTMQRMPSMGRSLSDFTRLAPASNPTGQGNSYGGISGRYNNVTVDGASFNNSFGLSSSLGASGIEPISLESIEQIQVMISPFDVRNGGFTGGGVNSVTKSGSNEWRVAAYKYFTDSKLEGLRQRDFKDERGESKGRQYGVSFSGPIIKNKLFFYVNGEYERQATSISFRPSNAGEEVGGNISGMSAADLQTISDYLGDNFGYNPGSYNVRERPSEGYRVTTRLDWNINSRNTLSVKYFYLKSFNTSTPSTSGATGGSRGPNENAIPFSSAYYRLNNNFNIVMADLNTKISDRLQNVLTVGYSALRDYRDMDGGYFPQVDILNPEGTFTVTTFGTEANSYNNMLNTDIYQIQDNLTLVSNKHTFTFGVQADLRKFLNGFSQNYPGAWQFGSIDDFKFNADAMRRHIQNGGNFYDFDINNFSDMRGNYAQGTTGIPKAFQETYSLYDDFPYAKIDIMQVGFYLQDKWSIRNNLHLTLGARFDIPIFLSDIDHNAKFDGVSFAGGQTINTSELPKTRVQVSPRIGFNWDVFNNRYLQVRGGTGLFSGTPPYVWISNQAGNTGMMFGSVRGGTAANNIPLSQAGFSGIIDFVKPAGANSSNATLADVAVTDQNFKYPTLFKNSIAADWRFWDDWIFTAEFLYSKNINDIYHENINLKRAVDVNGEYKYVNDQNNPAMQVRPYYGGGGKYSNDALSVVKLKNTNKGYSAYTTLKLQKNFTDGVMRGLHVAGSYTFGQAKAVTDGSSSVAYSAWRYRPAIDPNAQELGYTVGAIRDRVLVTASYRKEYGRNFASSIGVIYDRHYPSTSGVSPRFSYTYSGDVNGDGDTSNDLIYIPLNKDQINLVPGGSYTSTDEMWAALDNFINQDPYLSKHRGQYASRNGGIVPALNRIDLNFTQDFFFKASNGTRHTVRFTVDVRNFGNLLNRDWGVIRKGTLGNQQYQFLRLANSSTYNGTNPEFVFVDANANAKLIHTYMDWVNSLSRWGIQFGIKYMFN